MSSDTGDSMAKSRLRSLPKVNPWVTLFVVVSLLQFIRPSTDDRVVFWTSTVILILSEIAAVRQAASFSRPFLDRPAGPALGWAAAAVVALTGAVEPRHSLTFGWVMILAVLPAVLIYGWAGPASPPIEADSKLRKGVKFWSGVALTLCMIELVAIYLSATFNDLQGFPTMSYLLDPLIDKPWFKLVLFGVWCLLGFGLYVASRMPKWVKND